MRPKRLEVEGFGPFRERAVVDFEDAELFAFTGPTGSGKSSLVDAVVFALYGSVPRYGKRDVAPVVTQGMLLGKVLLDFAVGGSDFKIVRTVRLDARRRVTTEARLERGSEVMAGAAPEVTAAVEKLIGLDFDQFTTCVVLPQGEFERFLHARPADRQGLLVALLDLGIYDQVAQLAFVREAKAESMVSEIDRRLASLGDADANTLAAARARVAELEQLLETVDRETPLIEALAREGRESVVKAAALTERQGRLAAVRVPPGVAGLANMLVELRGAQAVGEASVLVGESAVETSEKALKEHPDRPALLAVKDRWETHTRTSSQVEELAGKANKAADMLRAAKQAMAEAAAQVERLRRRHEALHLRSGLEVGDPCPVCERPIESIPTASGAEPLADAERDLVDATRIHGEADRAGAAIAADLNAARERLVGLSGSLKSASTPGEIDAGLERIALLEDGLEKARADRDGGRKLVGGIRRQLDALGEQERSARRELQQTVLKLAEMEPPPLDLDDLAGDWQRLVDWIGRALPKVTAAAETAQRDVAELRKRHQDRSAFLAMACVDAGIEKGVAPRDSVFVALTSARTRFEQLTAQVEETRQLAVQRGEQADAMRVSKALVGHLRANNFEKWLLDEALRVLAAGANRRLAELARGQYSLALNARLDFEMIDHHAADERRSVQSLSGGETFLVSLALALSLADHIAEMSAVGTSRLEAILLDEGFGSLDSETLEAVAAVISEIGASGKMVGIISHVRGLADMAPVRFEVSKDAGTARVKRVSS